MFARSQMISSMSTTVLTVHRHNYKLNIYVYININMSNVLMPIEVLLWQQGCIRIREHISHPCSWASCCFLYQENKNQLMPRHKCGFVSAPTTFHFWSYKIVQIEYIYMYFDAISSKFSYLDFEKFWLSKLGPPMPQLL